eukprot:599459-Pleurochrysis_carterae.AAC.1
MGCKALLGFNAYGFVTDGPPRPIYWVAIGCKWDALARAERGGVSDVCEACTLWASLSTLPLPGL